MLFTTAMFHLVLPFSVTGLYYKYFDRLNKLDIDKNILFLLSNIHNGGLSVFSLYIFISLSRIIWLHGIHFQSGYYFNIAEFDRLALVFYVSKYYEFADIALVLLQKKNPLFLQKFHHIGAVICWHLCYVYKIDAIWTANLINSLIHTIMYSYYLLSLYKIPHIKKIKVLITGLQLIQLSSFVLLCPYAYYPPVESLFNYSIIMFFNAYICILIALFLDFSLKTYRPAKSLHIE